MQIMNEREYTLYARTIAQDNVYSVDQGKAQCSDIHHIHDRKMVQEIHRSLTLGTVRRARPRRNVYN